MVPGLGYKALGCHGLEKPTTNLHPCSFVNGFWADLLRGFRLGLGVEGSLRSNIPESPIPLNSGICLKLQGA